MSKKVVVVLEDMVNDDACANGCQRASGSPTGG